MENVAFRSAIFGVIFVMLCVLKISNGNLILHRKKDDGDDKKTQNLKFKIKCVICFRINIERAVGEFVFTWASSRSE